MFVAGIDLAWQSKRNPTALAVGAVEGDRLTLTLTDQAHDLVTVESIRERLDNYPLLRGVAIDAPLVIRNQTGQRPCEKLLSQEYGSRKASCHTSNLTLYPEPDSVLLSRDLENDGYFHLGPSDGKCRRGQSPSPWSDPSILSIFPKPRAMTK